MNLKLVRTRSREQQSKLRHYPTVVKMESANIGQNYEKHTIVKITELRHMANECHYNENPTTVKITKQRHMATVSIFSISILLSYHTLLR